jgi:prolyl 4-hydroxylase
MMIELNDLIQVYPNVLDENVCEFLIDFFESNSDKQERVQNDKKPNFTQLNLTEHCKISTEVDNVHNFLISKVFEYKRKYYEFVDDRCFPEKHNFEQFRIKKYNPDGDDLFDTHVDVLDYDTARRFLSFIFYLNDVEQGGETVFANLRVKPEKGSLLMFPPMWMFPHRGDPPISNTKYILSVYLHYR